MVLKDLRVKILFSEEVSEEYTAKGSQPRRRVCFLSIGVFPQAVKGWLRFLYIFLCFNTVFLPILVFSVVCHLDNII